MSRRAISGIACLVALTMTSCALTQPGAPGDEGVGPLRQDMNGVQEQTDSLVLVRHAGYWEESRPGDDRIYGYTVVVTSTGSVRFEVEGEERAGGEGSFSTDPNATAALLARSEGLDLDGVPDSIMGKEPWCNVVITDAPSVTITVFREGGMHRVTDYHGCSVEDDGSGDQLLSHLRHLEREVTRLLGLEERFGAAPLVPG